jgi:haloalkane dehalogenase
MSEETISAIDANPRKRVETAGTEIAYIDRGGGDPIVLLHGNPTSAYLWRNIIPHLAGLGRCLAPDLVGMGQSGKAPDGSYRFVDHARYLDGWFSALGLDRNVTLVVHDWGSAVGFHWANRHRAAVKGIAYMEAIVTPLRWDDWPDNARNIFQLMRSPAGDELVLEKNVFIERILPGAIQRKLTEQEMAVYREPWTEVGESRRPMLTWPRQIPIDGEPSDVTSIVRAYADWLSGDSTLPKLFVNADPGAILTGRPREYCRTWPNQREVTVAGAHFIQEDSPHQIGQAIANWYRALS